MRRSTPFLAAALAAALLLAGCSGREAGPAGTPAPVLSATGPPLEGWVLDATLSPLPEATVSVPSLNASVVSDGEGHYAFAGLPIDEVLLVTAEAPGYVPSSKSVTVPPEASVLLNFTLEPVPIAKPYADVKEFTGFLACEAVATAAEENHRFDCGGNDPNNNPSWEFSVGPDMAGAVIEVEWEPTTALARFFNLTLETVGYGDLDQVLSTVEGESVLRTQINRLQADRFYAQGGIVRLTIAAGTNVDEEEAGTGAALAFQQSFHVYASIFYVEGPSPTYTVIEA